MDHDHVFWVVLQPSVHVINKFEENYEGRGMMVLPVEVTHAVFKSFVIVGFLAYIKKMVFARMTLVQKISHLVNSQFVKD